MALENLGKTITLEAAGDLSTKQFCFVAVNTDGQAAAAGDGEQADGVLQNNPSAKGRAATVMVGTGITKVLLGGTVVAGDLAAADTNGAGVEAVSGDVVLGKYLGGGDSGEVVSLLFQPRAAIL